MPPNQGPLDLSYTQIDRLVTDFDGVVSSEASLQLLIDADLSNLNEGGFYWNVQSIYKVTDSGLNELPDTIIERTCYINEPASVVDVLVLDPTELSEEVIRGFDLAAIPMSLISPEGHYFQINQYSLSKAALSYWSGLDVLNARTGRLFERVPGEVPTNLKIIEDPEQKVYGFFYASEEKMLRRRVPENFYQDLSTICPKRNQECWNVAFVGRGPDFCRCQPCCDCRIVDNSSELLPDYWEE